MFITDQLAYLQLLKTGCTHIADLMAANTQGQQIGKHERVEPMQLGVKESGSRVIVGSIRNPWDWYVSLWAYGCKTKELGGIYNKLKRRRKIKKHFAFFNTHRSQFLEGVRCEYQRPKHNWLQLYNDSQNPENFRIWLTDLLSSHHRFDVELRYGYSGISKFSGYMSYRYAHIFWSDISELLSPNSITDINQLKALDHEYNMLDCIIRTENLEDDLILALQQAGYNLTKKQKNTIYQAKRSNTSDHSKTSYYFDQETLDLVAAKEKLIIDKYDYHAPKILS